MKESIPLAEAALKLKVSVRSVRAYVSKGKLDKVLIDGKTHITMQSLEAFAQQSGRGEGNTSAQASPHEGHSSALPSAPSGKIMVDEHRYEGLLVRLGQLEEREQRLIEYKGHLEAQAMELEQTRLRLRELEEELNQVRSKRSWWKRLWGSD